MSQTLVLGYTTVARVSTGLFSSSYDVPVLQKVPNGQDHDSYKLNQANGPCTGGSLVTLWGQDFGQSDFSASTMIGRFACISSLWVSDSTLVCRTASGAGINLSFQLKVGWQANTLTNAYSFDRLIRKSDGKRVFE